MTQKNELYPLCSQADTMTACSGLQWLTRLELLLPSLAPVGQSRYLPGICMLPLALPSVVSFTSIQDRKEELSQGLAACETYQPIMFHRNVCWRTGQGGAGILYIEEQDQIVRKKRTFQYNASNK